MSIIPEIIVIGIILFLGYKLLNKIMWTPIVFKRKSYNDDDFGIYLKLLFIRGYTRRGKGDGRFIVESMDRKGRKLIVRKYNFRNEIGMCLYIPEYKEGIEERVRTFLKENKIEEKVWREWRKEIDSRVVGVDMGDNFENGIKILRFAIDLILMDEVDKRRLKVYFKNIAQAREHYDFFIEQFEKDEQNMKKINRATNWMGVFFSGQR